MAEASSPATASPANTIVSRGFDTALRLTSVADWLGNTTSYAYGDAADPNAVTTVTYPGTTGESLTYGYDSANNVLSAAYSGPVLGGQSDNWSYNQDEQQATSQLLGGPTSSQVQYNAYRQITGAQNPGATSADNYQVQPNGQITQDQGPTSTTSYAYDAAGQLCWSAPGAQPSACGSVPSGATTYNFDANGQRTCATSAAGTSLYAWDAYGRLKSTDGLGAGSNCSSGQSGTTSYTYSGDGLRMSTSTGSATNHFVWDTVTAGTIPLDIDDGTNAYIYGPLLFGGTAPVEQIPLAPDSMPQFLSSTQSGVQAVFGRTPSLTSATSTSDQYTYIPTPTPVGQLQGAFKGPFQPGQIKINSPSVGDAEFLEIDYSSGIQVTGVSSSDATWTKLATEGSSGENVDLWMGVVTASGSTGLTISSTGSGTINASYQEFTIGAGSSSSWTTDSAGGAITTSAAPVSYPSLTASGAGELYVGAAVLTAKPQQNSTQCSATPAGYTCSFGRDPNSAGPLVVENPNISATTSPVATPNGSEEPSIAVGALIKVSGSSSGSNNPVPGSTAPSAPTVSGVSPSSGPAGGGTQVSISGTGFTGATGVHFGGVAASSYTVNSDSSVTATAPSSGDGPVDVQVTSALGPTTLFEQATYSLYGIRSVVAGTSVVTPFGYQGSYTDPTGLIYLINRYYDPSTDQFLSVDPNVAQTGQPYVYTGDDPLNATDPLGLSRWCRHHHCHGHGRQVPHWTSEKFSNWRLAEVYVAEQTSGIRHRRIETSAGLRIVDVLNEHTRPPTAIEVKTGRQSLNTHTIRQIEKDVSLQNLGHQTAWDFYPNGAGQTSPSKPLLAELHKEEIDVNIYDYRSPLELPPPINPDPIPDAPPWLNDLLAGPMDGL